MVKIDRSLPEGLAPIKIYRRKARNWHAWCVVCRVDSLGSPTQAEAIAVAADHCRHPEHERKALRWKVAELQRRVDAVRALIVKVTTPQLHPAPGWQRWEPEVHYAALRRHLFETHRDLAAGAKTNADAAAHHYWEHHGPCGLRLHQEPANLHYWDAPAGANVPHEPKWERSPAIGGGWICGHLGCGQVRHTDPAVDLHGERVHVDELRWALELPGFRELDTAEAYPGRTPIRV